MQHFETLKQFVFRKLSNNESILDKDIGQFCKDNWKEERDMPFFQAEVYKREYRALEGQKNAFDEKENKTISSYRNDYKNAKTKYFLRHEGHTENQYQPITKAYFFWLKDKGIKIINN